MYRLVVLLVCVAGCWGQSVQSGNCSDPSTIAVATNLDFTLFSGNWFQLERIPNPLEIGNCSTTTYVNQVANLTVSNREVANGVIRYRNGTLTRLNANDAEGRFVATYPGETPIPYLVLSTDYTGYALIYSCISNGNNTKSIWAWKLGRNTTLTTGQLSVINTEIVKYPELTGIQWFANDIYNCNGSDMLKSPILVLLAVAFAKIFLS